MIDTIGFKMHVTDKVLARLKDECQLQQLGIKLYHGGYFFLKHPFGLANPRVNIDWVRRTLSVETSVVKFLQGHNIFGTNRVQFLCLSMAKQLYHQIGLSFTPDEIKIVREKRFQLNRLDLVCSYRLNSQSEVVDALEECFNHLRATGRNWSVYGKEGIETVYSGQSSTRVAEKFYNKYVELTRRQIPSTVKERDSLLEIAKKLLRYEVVFRGKELRDLNLGRADLWTPELVKDALNERTAKLKLQGMIKEQLEPSQIEGLNNRDHMYYDLWAQGVGQTFKRHKHNTTVRRAHEGLLRHGIDIFRPYGNSNVVDLSEILTPDNAYYFGPKCLSRSGAIIGAA